MIPLSWTEQIIYQPIIDKTEAARAFEKLKGGFASSALAFPDYKIGFQGGAHHCEVYWHDGFGLWGVFESGVVDGRYWICFGLGDPADSENLSITVEINPPIEGINRRCAGLFVQKPDGGACLAHSGKVGGGRKGIGKAAFREYARGNSWNEIAWPDGKNSDYRIIADLDGPELVTSIGNFVREVAEFKEWVTSSTRTPASTPTAPRLGQKFDEALALASELHREQNRKESPIPYISHLMAVAGIVMEANAYHPMDNVEDVAIGALLHDAVEDQGHKIDLEMVEHKFGATVKRIVEECSDAIVTNQGENKPPWKERKERYLSKISSKSKETLLVSCADKLHNARCIMFDFDRVGERVWDRFTAGKEGTVWYYESLVREFSRAWAGNPLLPDFEALVTRMRAVARKSCS